MWLLPGTYEAVSGFWADGKNKEYQQIAERTKQLLSGYYSNFGLELLASVDFILQNQVKNQVLDDDAKVLLVLDSIKNWNERKRKLFTEKHIRDAVTYLEQFPQ